MNNDLLLIPLLSVLLLLGCVKEKDETYVKCQSFDEFSMTEICTDNIVSPYLFVQRQKDTIRIITSTNLKDTMIYLNKGSYWYSSIRIDYQYCLWGKLCMRFRPLVFGHDIVCMYVFRYIFDNTILEVYCEDYDDSVLTGSRGYDYIIVSDKEKSVSYHYEDELPKSIDTTKIQNTLLLYLYRKFEHEAYGGTINYYEYDDTANVLYELYKSNQGIIIDTIPLNSLQLYHVPAYDFSTVSGNYVYGFLGYKMRINVKCTTLETDFNTLTIKANVN